MVAGWVGAALWLDRAVLPALSRVIAPLDDLMDLMRSRLGGRYSQNRQGRNVRSTRPSAGVTQTSGSKPRFIRKSVRSEGPLSTPIPIPKCSGSSCVQGQAQQTANCGSVRRQQSAADCRRRCLLPRPLSLPSDPGRVEIRNPKFEIRNSSVSNFVICGFSECLDLG